MTTRNALVTLLLLAALAACNLAGPRTGPAAATRAAAGSSFGATLTSGGVERHYLLHVPAGYRPGTPVALVVNLHGLGSNAQEQEALSGMSAKADASGFLVVYPDGIDNKWHVVPGDDGVADRRFIRDLVGRLENEYDADPARVYATGISNGGGMTNRLGCDLADVFAAIAPVAGAYNMWRDCAPARPLPVLAFHGTADNVVPYEGMGQGGLLPPIHEWAAAWAGLNGCAAEPTVTHPRPDVLVDAWPGCSAGSAVILYSIDRHGHSWPGSRLLPAITSQAVNATDVMWQFFQAHPLR